MLPSIGSSVGGVSELQLRQISLIVSLRNGVSVLNISCSGSGKNIVPVLVIISWLFLRGWQQYVLLFLLLEDGLLFIDEHSLAGIERGLIANLLGLSGTSVVIVRISEIVIVVVISVVVKISGLVPVVPSEQRVEL